MKKSNYYTLEITEEDTNYTSKLALFSNSPEVKLLLEDLKGPEEEIEFSGRMRFNPQVIEDNYDGLGSKLYDYNIIEVVSAKKVRV